MKKRELNKILKSKNLELNIIDKMNKVTLKQKKKWEIQKIVEEYEKCLKCKEETLVDCDLEGNLIMCTKCGEIFEIKDYIKN